MESKKRISMRAILVLSFAGASLAALVATGVITVEEAARAIARAAAYIGF